MPFGRSYSVSCLGRSATVRKALGRAQGSVQGRVQHVPICLRGRGPVPAFVGAVPPSHPISGWGLAG